jgi:thiamine phosphate synthase YjbQ (UPF0047 family)
MCLTVVSTSGDGGAKLVLLQRLIRRRAGRGRAGKERFGSEVVGVVTAIFRIRLSERPDEFGRNKPGGNFMKSHTEYLVFETEAAGDGPHHRRGGTDCAAQRRQGRAVLCFSDAHHGGGLRQRPESGLIEDIGKWLEELAPARPDYKHHQTGEDNGDAHLKSLLLHHETTLPVTNGKLDLGNMAARLLCRVRRPAPQAGDREGAGRRVKAQRS